MTPWLTIVGIGEDGIAGLAPASLAAVKQAEIVVGSARVLEAGDFAHAETHVWTPRLDDTLDRLPEWRGRRVVVLATGDPSNYGVARKVLARVPLAETSILPAPSAFSLAAARLGWSLPDVDCTTLHGRESSRIEPHIVPDARIIALTWDARTIPEVANRLCDRGFEESLITVFEHMGGPLERCLQFRACDDLPADIADFNTIAVACTASRNADFLPRVPGLLDSAFAHDGQITKSEVRAATIANLAPYPDAFLWDVGAGCGSVSIEWMRAARGARAIAFERDAGRVEMLHQNASALGTPDLVIVAGELPETLTGQPQPDAVFIGGAVADETVFEAAWEALRPGGRLVANAVTLEGESALYARQHTFGGDLARIEVSELTPVGGWRAMRPRMAVTQWRVGKPPERTL